MSAAELVERAAALGVSLWIEGERIGIEGPAHSVATIRPELAARKPEIMKYLLTGGTGGAVIDEPPARQAANDPQTQPDDDDCAGALVDPLRGPYLPWGPHLAADNVRRLRAGLFAMIAEIANAEGWPRERFNGIMSRAVRGPLSDLLPNIEYFHSKVIERRAETEARALLAARSWKLEGLDDRHACPGCDGSCLGTKRSCTRRA
ncbi:hypothetical protein ACFQ3P_30225 [Paraburkholderia sabiae]|uniref:TubC N-terminal docking domain-containing protein n=1 Tax=Paraburkholderia sabiae TaxID=273251 RepID=A0ABU9QNA4_9BURK|nr:hypothetical protein [Paraburkholderia sabiae]WJZ74914.1 hypothetical protein QEN71_03605 [Paraburkholderia sabiae]CAD6551438.1 hypothetical protein LMG24235_04933 [Paraburkholderia sabiae]